LFNFDNFSSITGTPVIDFNPLITVPAYEEAKVPFTLAQAFSINEAQRAFPVGYANKN